MEGSTRTRAVVMLPGDMSLWSVRATSDFFGLSLPALDLTSAAVCGRSVHLEICHLAGEELGSQRSPGLRKMGQPKLGDKPSHPVP